MTLSKTLMSTLVLAAMAAPAMAEGTLDKVKAAGSITVGHRDASIPFSYLDDKQQPIGYAMDLCARVVDAVKTELKLPALKVVYQPVTSATRIPLLANGTIDIECGSTTNNAERQKQVSYTITHFLTANRFVSKKASNLNTLADLKGKTVVSTSGTTNIKQLTELNAAQNLGINILAAKDHAESFLMVETGRATAFDQQGRSIATSDYLIAVGVKTADVKFELPVELRNEVVRIAIDGAGQAGSVQLLDERFRRRRVGLISGGNSDQAQPLLSPLYYISRALEPFSDVRPARQANVAQAVPELVNERISTLVLADIGTLPSETLEQVENWVDAGGMLIRFAGSRLAAAEDDTLVPVALRRGGRSLGGTLTWGTPEPLANFDTDSPFNGIPVPDDVSVTRQVLAEPGIDLEDKTWASLADGTPLVTAAQRGKGWIVLFHVTADASWSNLPLSGAFVDMLRRIVAVSNGAVAADKTRAGSNGTVPAGEETGAAVEVSLSPLRMISSTGAMAAPGPNMRPLVLAGSAKPVVSLENPPGTYGTSDAFVALNLFEQDANLNEIDPAILPANTRQQTYAIGDVAYFKPWLLGAALLLLALDCLAVLWMAGALRREARPAAAVATAMNTANAMTYLPYFTQKS